MNKETQELLQKLAEKLGTTVEYLWQVLLKQAQIDAFTTLFQFALIALFGITLYRLHKKFLKPISDDRYSDNLYSKYDEGIICPMFIGAIVFAILAICAFFSITDMVNGFLNPEYWALQRILSATT